jgi:hypothetical protein
MTEIKLVFPALSPGDGDRSNFQNVMFLRVPDDGQSRLPPSPKKSVIPNSGGVSEKTNSAVQTYSRLPFLKTATGPNRFVVLSAHL